MKKRTRAAALALSLCLLTGCTHFAAEGETLSLPAGSAVSAAVSPYARTDQRSDYASLPSDDCRALYDAVAQVAGGIAGQKQEKGYPLKPASARGSLSDDDVERTVMAYLNDHPQAFWISNVYSYTLGSGSVRLQLYSRLDPAGRDTRQQALNAAVQEILAQVPANLPELDREAAVYEALAGRCTYAQNAQMGQDQSGWEPYTAYGALVEGAAVCDGYARAMQLLCGEVGLQNRLVNGQSKGEAHIWNLIRIDGQWYHFDGTWMDSGARTYDYFNLTDQQIQADHTISAVDGPADDCNLPMEAAAGGGANYYAARAVQINALDGSARQAVAQALVDAVGAGRGVVALRIGDSLDFHETVSGLFQSAPYFFQSCVQRGNGALPAGKKLDYTAMQFSTAEEQRGISVQLAYQK